MKVTFFFLGILIGFTILSCSSDDNSTPNTNELIIGEWNYTSQTLNGENLEFEDDCQKDFEYQIYTANGSYQQTEFENISGAGCESVSPTNGTWIINENTLSLTIDGDTNTLTISELTQNNLVYKINFDYDDDGTVDEFIQKLTRRN